MTTESGQKRLTPRVAVVTGAGSGIGRAIALGLAAEGDAICVSDINGEAASGVAGEIEAAGGRAIVSRCDVSQTADVEAMIEETVQRLGGLHILVNNAGRAARGWVTNMTDEEWDGVFAVNVRGTFLCSRAALRHMIPQRYGRIVNTASGLGTQPSPGGAVYGASKAAVIHFTRSLAQEVARYGITVNVFTPGVTDTPFWRASRPEEEIAEAYRRGRVGQPEDLVPTVLFLCTDAARDISGALIERQVFVQRQEASNK